MKILVTGASGFIGGAITHHLSNNPNFQVVASGRSTMPENLSIDRISYLQMDLTGELPALNFDVCIHCAGLADDKSSKENLHLNNAEATQNLLKNLKGCKKIIFISSSSVYNFELFPFASEEYTHLSHPLSEYGKSKLIAEEYIINSGIESIYILRPRAVYGKGDRVLLPRILGSIKWNRFIVPGDLQVKTSLTNIQQLIEACDSAVGLKETGLFIFNVADDKEYNLKDVFIKIGKLKSDSIKITSVPVGLVRRILKICKALNIPVSFSEQTVDYLTKDSNLNVSKVKEILGLELNDGLDDFLKNS